MFTLRPTPPSAPRLAILLFASCLNTATAELTVYSPETITHRVKIQPIQVKKTDGSIATFMGDATSESYMKSQINRAWAQLGVEIEWLPINDYTDNFTFDGSPADYTSSSRPNADLGTILGDGDAPKSSDPITINLFFVGIAPGFKQLSEYTAAGLARIDSNGSAIYVGNGLTTWDDGRDGAAGVIAHEIGHNLGLYHYQSSKANLMYSGGKTASYLLSSQQDVIFTDRGGIDGFDLLQSLVTPTNFDQWAVLHGLQQGASGDDDLDRLSNGLEFLYGSNPTTFTVLPAPTSTVDGLVWSLPKESDALDDGYSYAIESSSQLSNWLPLGSAGSGSTLLHDIANELSFRLDFGNSCGFIRIGVNLPPASGSLLPASLQMAVEEEREPLHSDCAKHGCGLITVTPN